MKVGYRIVLYHMTSGDEGMPVMLFYIVWLVSSIQTLVLFDGWMDGWYSCIDEQTQKMESELMAGDTDI